MNDFKQMQAQYEFDVFGKRGPAIVSGRNDRVYDDRGREYIDCTSGHGVASVGHANEQVADAVTRQAQRLITCGGAFYNDERARLLAKIAEITPVGLTRTFLCNSGAESVEAAIKFARFSTGRTGFVCAMRGFHGRTLGALSATFNPKYKKEFEPLVPGFSFVPFNDSDRMREAVNGGTAAVILELVQGEGGVHIADSGCVARVAEICRENGALLIIDEIQTGFCRTGRMFACEQYGLTPDMLCLGKAIAGGLPMGAVVCSGDIAVPRGRHGSTFGGNPLCCAAANAAIGFMMEKRLHEEAERKGAIIAGMLKRAKLPAVREIRHIGLMIGIELKMKAAPYIESLAEQGVLTLPAGATVFRLLPPLTIEETTLREAGEKIIDALCDNSGPRK